MAKKFKTFCFQWFHGADGGMENDGMVFIIHIMGMNDKGYVT
jgi:hypothetical protein